jgi:hypothetical protein
MHLQKYMPGVTVHCEAVSNSRRKRVMLFAWQERGEAKIHALSHPKVKMCSSMVVCRPCRANRLLARRGCHSPVEVIVRPPVETPVRQLG